MYMNKFSNWKENFSFCGPNCYTCTVTVAYIYAYRYTSTGRYSEYQFRSTDSLMSAHLKSVPLTTVLDE